MRDGCGKGTTHRDLLEILRISRIIIHLKFRGIGLAQVLVKQTMPQVNARIVECVAAMAKYNPFFEKAGMTLAGTMELQPDQKKLLAFIEGAGGKVSLLQNKALCKAFLNNLNSEQMSQLQSTLNQNIGDIGGASPGRMKGLEEMMRAGDFSKTRRIRVFQIALFNHFANNFLREFQLQSSSIRTLPQRPHGLLILFKQPVDLLGFLADSINCFSNTLKRINTFPFKTFASPKPSFQPTPQPAQAAPRARGFTGNFEFNWTSNTSVLSKFIGSANCYSTLHSNLGLWSAGNPTSISAAVCRIGYITISNNSITIFKEQSGDNALSTRQLNTYESGLLYNNLVPADKLPFTDLFHPSS